MSARSNSDIILSEQFPFFTLTEIVLPSSGFTGAPSAAHTSLSCLPQLVKSRLNRKCLCAYDCSTCREVYRVRDWRGKQKELVNRELQCALMKLCYLRPPAELCAIFPFSLSNGVLFTTDVL